MELEPEPPLDIALKSRRWDLFELLLEWGADLRSASPRVILETYSTELYERSFAAGYDLTRGHAMASMLGFGTSNRPLYGFVKRHRLEDSRIQREVDIALGAHVREGNKRGIISLCLWAGADPHASVPDLGRMYRDDDRSMGWSAIELAVHEGDLEMLKKLRPDPARDDFDDLYRPARSQHAVQYLAAMRLPVDLTSILQFHLLFIAPGPLRSYSSIWALEAILASGIQWRESDRDKLSHVRRSLAKIRDDDFKTVLRLLGKPAICDPGTFAELTRTKPMQERLLALHLIWPKMSEAEKLEGARERLGCRYDREKLYGQVWAEPMQRVAASYGISDVRLGKVCRILHVPVPPRGYWARLRSGQEMRRPQLPKLQ